VIGRRLNRLSEATNKVLTFASVIGRQFDLALLTRVAVGSPLLRGEGEVVTDSASAEDQILDALDEATRTALIAEVPGSPDSFTFSHALIRATLYEELSSARRARLHRKVGEALEELTQGTPGTRIDELAHHWLRATQVADAAKAIGYARQAGDKALLNLAFEEAAEHYAQALAVLEPRDGDGGQLRCDLLLALADGQCRSGSPSYRETVAKAAELARALGDGERLALAALASARPGGYLASTNLVDEGLIALYEEARAALGEADSLLRARVLGQLAAELVYTPERERRHALSGEAVAIARRLGDPLGLGQALILRLIATNDPFTLAERLEMTADLLQLASGLGSSELQWHAAYHRTGALLESGDLAGAEQGLADVERFAAQLRQPFYTWIARLGRTMFAIMRGAPDAEAEVYAACEVGMAGGQPDAAIVMAPQLFMLRYDQGRLAEHTDIVRSSVEAQPHIPGHRAALALVFSEQDRMAEAREQLDILRIAGFELPPDWTWMVYAARLSEAVCDLQDRTTAAVLYEQIRPLARQVDVLAVMVLCEGSCAFWCGLLAACLGRWDDAERHFTDALAMNGRLGARPYVVRTRRAWASMLLDRGAPGDATRARELIAAGHAEAEQLGMAREIVRLERLPERVA
jgi:tetratricopeptide (TPR) repeat protein